MKVSLSLLQEAKSYLCWDVFPGLAMQLVPIENTTAWYFPPEKELDRIFVFYRDDAKSLAEALFYLFHEAGHLVQKQSFEQNRDMHEFQKMLELDRGARKAAFEQQAWALGEPLLERYLHTRDIDPITLLDPYRDLAVQSVSSYLDPESI